MVRVVGLKRAIYLFSLLLVTLFIISLLHTSVVHGESKLLNGIAINEKTNVYEEKDHKSNILKTYKQGTLLIFKEDEDENWYQAIVIINGESKNGYIYKEDVELVTDSPTNLTGYSKNKTNVYVKPNRSSKVLRSYQKGRLLYYQTFTSEWHQAIVILNGERQVGYIHVNDVEEPVNEQTSLSGFSMKNPTNIYEQPNKKSKVLKTYNSGRFLYYKTFLSDWYEAVVIINGVPKTGYIHVDDVQEPDENPIHLKGVSKNKTNIYTNLNPKSKVLKSYPEGSILQFQTLVDGWYKAIVYVNGKPETGYIKASDVELPTTEPIHNRGIALKNKTSVYAKPSKNSKVLKSYNVGHVLQYRTFIDNWYEATVIINGKPVTGYINVKDVDNVTSNQVAVKGYAKKSKTKVYKNLNKNSKVLKSYNEGHLLQYKTFTDHWYEATVIINGKAQTGYIHKNDVLDLNSKRESYKGAAIKKKSYVYSKPSKSSKRLKGYEYGSNLQFKSFTDNWYEAIVIINGKAQTGYIHKNDVIIGSLKAKSIVNPKQVYTYEQMVKDIKALEKAYPGLVTSEIIGKSVDNRNIYAVKLGTGNVKITINAATHAREWISTNLVMYQIDQYSQAYLKNEKIDGYDVRDLLNKVSIYYVPMVNPDGVTLVQKGPYALKNSSQLIKLNNGSKDFKHWKANANGVDLNRNYPLGWYEPLIADPGRPASQNFKGYKPLSEPESRALANFSLKHDFKTAIAYHSSGEVVYWEYGKGKVYSELKRLALLISNKTGYPLRSSLAFGGGYYTHWFTEVTGGLSATPELSPYVGNRPVPLSNFDRIWKQNYSVGLMLADEAYKNRNKR